MYKKPFIYNAKTLFTGYKLGLKNANLYIAVPEKHFSNSTAVKVNYAGTIREVFESDVIKRRTFNDKFRPGENYIFYYFLWRKVSEEALENDE